MLGVPGFFPRSFKPSALAMCFYVLAVFSTSSALAAEIGKIQLNGRQVILNDDFTWSYGSDAPSVKPDCTDVGSEVVPLLICLDPGKWTFANLGGEAEHKLGLKGQELYLLFITEKTELSVASLKKAALSNAQDASGLSKVKTLLDQVALFDGHEFGVLEYATTVDGIDITYANYLTSFGDEGAAQFVFFAATNQFDGFRQVISEAMAGVAITD